MGLHRQINWLSAELEKRFQRDREEHQDLMAEGEALLRDLEDEDLGRWVGLRRYRPAKDMR